jgi:hypothetical protein
MCKQCCVIDGGVLQLQRTEGSASVGGWQRRGWFFCLPLPLNFSKPFGADFRHRCKHGRVELPFAIYVHCAVARY